MKTCTKCGEEKPLSEFYKAATTRDGLRGDCKACFKKRSAGWYEDNREHVIARVKKWQAENPDRVAASRQRRIRDPRRDRDQHLRRTFGITLEDFDAMLEAQGGGCAICGRSAPEGASLHVDHDHETGVCAGCCASSATVRSVNSTKACGRSRLHWTTSGAKGSCRPAQPRWSTSLGSVQQR